MKLGTGNRTFYCLKVLLLDRRPVDPVVPLGRDAHNLGMSERHRFDRVGATGATLALLVTVSYIWLMRQPGNRMLAGWAFDTPMPRGYATYSTDQGTVFLSNQGIRPWLLILAVLLAATALAGYGAWISSPFRRVALLLAGVVLALIGIRVLQTISLIGAPLFLAGLICLVAAARRQQGTIDHQST